jgi:hypothetical protein
MRSRFRSNSNKKLELGIPFVLLLFTLLFISTQSAAAYTNSGTIPIDETWSGLVEIVADVTVPANVILHIDPGTTIKFADNTGLYIYGKLEATGTAQAPITFTSASASPTRGVWPGIRFNDSALDAGNIDHAVIEWAGNGIIMDHAQPTIRNSSFVNNLNGIYLNYSNALIEGCTFWNNRDTGILLTVS